MSQQSPRERLLTLFRETEEAIAELASSRTPDEQDEHGQAEHGQAERWSAGDLLTAIAFWMDYTVERMAYFQRGETPPRGGF